jgi:hypothetical protein
MRNKNKIQQWRKAGVPRSVRRLLLAAPTSTVWADDAERLRLLGARRGVDHTRHDAECQECRDHPTFLCIMEMLYESWSLDLPNGKKLQLKTSWGGIDSCES